MNPMDDPERAAFFAAVIVGSTLSITGNIMVVYMFKRLENKKLSKCDYAIWGFCTLLFLLITVIGIYKVVSVWGL